MKTGAETKFDYLIKEAFTRKLTPPGFKKKAGNFYLDLGELGHLINIQKSRHNTKDHIRFTINTGVFLPEFWLVYYNYHNDPVPEFPTAPDCLTTYRIGALRNGTDIWYDLLADTDEIEMTIEMEENLEEYIFPFLASLQTKKDLLLQIDKLVLPPLGRLLVYAELNQTEAAKAEFDRLLSANPNPHFLKTLEKYGKKYGFL